MTYLAMCHRCIIAWLIVKLYLRVFFVRGQIKFTQSPTQHRGNIQASQSERLGLDIVTPEILFVIVEPSAALKLCDIDLN